MYLVWLFVWTTKQFSIYNIKFTTLCNQYFKNRKKNHTNLIRLIFASLLGWCQRSPWLLILLWYQVRRINTPRCHTIIWWHASNEAHIWWNLLSWINDIWLLCSISSILLSQILLWKSLLQLWSTTRLTGYTRITSRILRSEQLLWKEKKRTFN